jgi:hypothetical protein
MKRNCKNCLGIGWVCENYPDKAWSDELGASAGRGCPALVTERRAIKSPTRAKS